MKNPLKTVVLALTFVLLLGLAPHALAQSSFVPLAEIPGLTSGDVANSSDLASFFNNLYKYLIGLAAILAIIEIIWGGLEYSTQDNISKKSDGKARIYQALSGLLLVLAPALVFGIINPSILKLGINLTPLPTSSRTSPSAALSPAAPIKPTGDVTKYEPQQGINGQTIACVSNNNCSEYASLVAKREGKPLDTSKSYVCKRPQGICITQ